MIIAVMYLLSLLIIGVCLHKVYSHKNYKGRKRIIVRYKETILIIMYKDTECPTLITNPVSFKELRHREREHGRFFILSIV